MGKENKNLENLDNPFNAFSILKGEFTDTSSDKDDDIVDPNDDIVDDKDGLEDDTKKKADELLNQVAEKQKKAAAKKEKVEVEETDDDLEDEEIIDTSKNNTSAEEETGIKGFAKHLYEKGTLDFDDSDEDFEDSEEGLEKLINKTVQNRIDKWAQSLPEDYAKMLEFVQAGGSPKQFLDIYYGNHSWEDFNLESEDNQKIAVKESLKLAGESDEDIKDMIDEWEVNGTLEKRAKSAITKLQKYEKSQKEELVKIQKEQAEKQKQVQLEYWNNFKKELYDKEQIAGFKLTPKTKDKLWEFMTAVDKRTGKTPYEQAIESNKESSYLFAYLAMNNFDSGKLEKQVETKVSNRLSGVLKNYSKDTKNRISSGRTDENYDSDPFSGFKKLK